MMATCSITCRSNVPTPKPAAAFYDAVLATVGGKRIMEFGPVIGYGVDFPDFWIGPVTTGDDSREVHIAFTAPTGPR